MTSTARADAATLLGSAQDLYADRPETRATLEALQTRLAEPLRLALAGIVKAGKSTLLNALVGERIAPTDAGECTRVVTWYRFAPSPTITVVGRDGSERRIPVKRHDGALVIDLGDRSADEIDRIEVGWPSSALASVILIDTPGIASLSSDISARSQAFLAPEEAPSEADAIIYLMRHLHPSDLHFLEAFRDTAAGSSRTVNALGVLSRADEIGSGRIDSLLSAAKVARRYELDGRLASLALGVLPVTGLLAEAARTLRHDEFVAFRTLAGLERAQRDRLLVSADRFVRPVEGMALTAVHRTALLSRFGIFGVRLAISLVRSGVRDATELGERLVQHSGLLELERFVERQFAARADALKVRAALDGLERILDSDPRDGVDDLRAGIERIRAREHALQELALLSDVRVAALPLPPTSAEAVARIVGGHGTTPTQRLGLPADADADTQFTRLAEELDRWRATSHAPTTDQAALALCAVVIRSLEGLISEIGAGPRTDGAPADVVLADGPRDGRAQGAGEEGE